MTDAMNDLALLDSDFAVWWATGAECVSALSLRLRTRDIRQTTHQAGMARLAAARSRWTVFPPAEAIRLDAERLLLVHPLRAADAFQLAAALCAADGDPNSLEFVSLDNRLAQAARNEGFVVRPY
jgi:predicted nucleic acid-binding protein